MARRTKTGSIQEQRTAAQTTRHWKRVRRSSIHYRREALPKSLPLRGIALLWIRLARGGNSARTGAASSPCASL